MELHDASDFNAFQFYINHLTKKESKSSGFVATGAEVVEVELGVLGLVWGHSGRLVDVREGGLFKPATGYHWDLVQGNYLFLEPKQFSEEEDIYRQDWPPFHLKPWLYEDSSYEFACMKEGINA